MKVLVDVGNKYSWLSNIVTIVLGLFSVIGFVLYFLPAPYSKWAATGNQPYVFLVVIVFFVISFLWLLIVKIATKRNLSRTRSSSLKSYIEEVHGEDVILKFNRICIIDDQPENYDVNYIRSLHYDVSVKKEISLSDVDDLGKYDVLILDISNVVIEDKINGGLELMRRAREKFPGKAIIAASSKKYDPSMTSFFESANVTIDTPIAAMDLEGAIVDAIVDCYSKMNLASQLDEELSGLSIEKHNIIVNLIIDFIEGKSDFDGFNAEMSRANVVLDNKKIRNIIQKIKSML